MYSEIDARGPHEIPGKAPSPRGVLTLLAAATATGSTGLAAGGTAGALLGAELAGTSAAAGLPVALLVVGSAGGAVLVSAQAGRGRRGRGLAIGYLVGAAGAVLVILAAVARSVPLLLFGSVVLGVANSSVFMARYAALGVGSAKGRGLALGGVFVGTAVGAVLSPLLMGPSGALAEAAGLPALTGLYLVAVAAFGLAALMFAAASVPRVPVLGRAASVLSQHRVTAPTTAELLGGLRGRRVRDALVTLALANFVMVAYMSVAPVHLLEDGHGLQPIGLIVALHVAGMFAPSPFTGHLADRFGAAVVVMLGWVLLLAVCLLGLLVSTHGTTTMAIHLLILGLAWNCGIVTGSALLAASVPDGLRPHVEGVGEVVMQVAAMLAAPAASVLTATAGYPVFSLVCACVALGALIYSYRSRGLTTPRGTERGRL